MLEITTGGPSRNLCLTAALAMISLSQPCAGQKSPYAGLLGGVSTLSADGRSTIDAQSAATSSYKPENGSNIDLFAGLHWSHYLSFQLDYLWNRNALTLDAVRANPNANAGFYERKYGSSQHAAIGNALLYFRDRSSWARPFLSVGTGIAHVSSDPRSPDTASKLTAPSAFRSNVAVLHVAVGIDLRIRRGWAFRYSFAETASRNPISRQLDPPGTRRLANFRNLFGFVKEF